ncbi:MAG: RNA polymerase sigma factor [Pseudomonadota bacterium]
MTDEIRANLAVLVPRLRRFAMALCGNRDDGDDLVQTACMKALDRAAQFEPGTRLDSWMFRIVQTTFLDQRRKLARRGQEAPPEALDALSDEGREAGRHVDRLLLASLRERIAELPEDQRLVLGLVAIEGYTYKETAEILDIPVGTVMSRLSRARARLLPLTEDGVTC